MAGAVDRQLDISGGRPTDAELFSLRERGRRVLESLRGPETELPRPLFVEFAGTPKSGKSSCIATLHHFFRRCGLSDGRSFWKVAAPPEGVSLRAAEWLKDDLLAYNAWSACYALQNQLLERFAPDGALADLYLADRGIFDARVWGRFLSDSERLSQGDWKRIDAALEVAEWARRSRLTFVFVADPGTAMAREHDGKLIEAQGGAMNKEFLSGLVDAYRRAVEDLSGSHRGVCLVDTSFVGGQLSGGPDFSRIAYAVADRILGAFEEEMAEQLLVTTVEFGGYCDDRARTEMIVGEILSRPQYRRREEAEATNSVRQVVPYALLRKDGRWFCTRRVKRGHAELRGRLSLLVGGHAERKDMEPVDGGVDGMDGLESCLRREIKEELVGLEIVAVERVGLILDGDSAVGSRHLAVLHVVDVGGTVKVRKGTNDQEFGDQRVEWISDEEIRERVGEFDPWSSMVAEHRFGARVAGRQAGLFSTDVR